MRSLILALILSTLSACSPSSPIVVDLSPKVCPVNQHLAYEVCVDNVRSCVVDASNLTGNDGSGTQSWDVAARAWGECLINACDAGFNLVGNSCVPTAPPCPTGEHMEAGLCELDVQACPVTNGNGQKVWGGSSYGPCVITSCQSTFHEEAGSCLPDLRSCVVVNGNGQEQWNGSSYNTCTVLGCDSGYHEESNACVDNVRSCVVADGTGQEVWNGSAYDACLAVACNSGFHLNAGACEANVLDCTVDITNAAAATQTWNGSAYEACDLQACQPTFHEESNACVDDVRSCVVANGQGQEQWNGSSYDACVAISCDASFHLEANACASDSRACVILNGTGSQDWLGNQWSECGLVSCDLGYVANGNLCELADTGQNMVVDFDFINYAEADDRVELYPSVTGLGTAVVTNVELSLKKIAPTVVEPYIPGSGFRCVDEAGGGNEVSLDNCWNGDTHFLYYNLDNDDGTYEITLSVTNDGGFTISQTKTIINAPDNDSYFSPEFVPTSTFGEWAQTIDNQTLVSMEIPLPVLNQNISSGAPLQYRWRVRALNRGDCRYPVNPPANDSHTYTYTLNVDGNNPGFNYVFNTALAVLAGSGCPDTSAGGEYNVQLRVIDTTATAQVAKFWGYNVRVNQGQSPMVTLDQHELFMTTQDLSQHWLTNWGNTVNAGEPMRFKFSNFNNPDGDNTYRIYFDLTDDGVDDFYRDCVGDCEIVLDPALNPSEYFQTKVGGGACLDGDTCLAQEMPIRMKLVDSNGDLAYFDQWVDLGSTRRPIIINDGGSLFYSVIPEQRVNGPAEVTINPFSGGVEVTLDAHEAMDGWGGPCTGCLYSWDVNNYVIFPGDTDFTHIDDGTEYENGVSPYFTFFYTQISENTLPYSLVRQGNNWAIAPTNLRINPPADLPDFDQSNLGLWLKADSLGAFADNAFVNAWDDSSPMNKHFLQTQGNLQPQMKYNRLNGYPSVLFEGVDAEADGQHMIAADGLEEGTETGVSVFAVARTINGGPEVKYPILLNRMGDIFPVGSQPGFAFGFDYNTYGSSIYNSMHLLTEHTTGYTDFGKVESITPNSVVVAYMAMDGVSGTNSYFIGDVGITPPYNYYGNQLASPYLPTAPLTPAYVGLKTTGFWARNPGPNHFVEIFEILYFRGQVSLQQASEVIHYLKTKYNL